MQRTKSSEGRQILLSGIQVWKEKPESGSPGHFQGDGLGLFLVMLVITGIRHVSELRELQTQRQASQDFPGGPVVKNHPAI